MSIKAICLLLLTVMALSRLNAYTFRYYDVRRVNNQDTLEMTAQGLVISFKPQQAARNLFFLTGSLLMKYGQYPCGNIPILHFIVTNVQTTGYRFILTQESCAFDAKGHELYFFGEFLEHNNFKQIWIFWGDGKARIGMGSTPYENTMINMTFPYESKMRKFELQSFKKGDWIISVNIGTDGGETYRAVHPRVNISTGIIWREVSENLELCAVLCHQSDVCRSYTYSHKRQVCQGHKGNYNELNDVTYVEDEDSVYFG